MSENNMSVAELQQIISAVLDAMESMKKENDELKKALSFCMNCIKEDRESNLHSFKAIEQEYWKMNCRIAYLKNCEKLRLSDRKIRDSKSVRYEGKGVVYTVITGGYDEVTEIEYKNPDLSYILFTDDRNLRSKTWEIRYIESDENIDKSRLSRKPKILAHEYLSEFDYSVYVDANMTIRGDLAEYINRYRGEMPILCCAHYSNDCIYDEANACIRLKKDDPVKIEIHIGKLREEGYPIHNGLIAGGLIVREHNDPEVIRVMNAWWNMILNYSKRDQLSFDYSCWKNGIYYDMSDILINENEYVIVNYNHD